MLSYYKVLGVPNTAPQADIKTAYRRLARKFHPDHNGGHPLADQRFRLLAEAWEVLQDEERRRKYDRFGSQGLVRGRDRAGVAAGVERFVANLESIVESRLKSVPRRGEDRRRILAVSLEDACYGAQSAVEVTRNERCNDCGGGGAQAGTQIEACHVCDGRGTFSRGTLLRASDACPFCQGGGKLALSPCLPCDGLGRLELTRSIEVKIPTAVESGRRLILRSYGASGSNGAASGDLFLEVQVQPHAVFVREAHDLRCTVPVLLREAVEGGTVDVPQLRGASVTIRIPRGCLSGQVLRLKGRGAPKPDGSAGDLLARVEIETPVIGSKRGRELLLLLEAECSHPRREAWDKRS
ncbi:MAG: molecular chaperone DnaJ [Myxococcota bacterium]|jgi:molecular chaperone DnaJ